MRGETPRKAVKTASGLEARRLIGTKPAVAQAWLRLALPFNGRAGFWAFYKAICNRCSEVLPPIRQWHPLRSRESNNPELMT
jgi:hypothetical protein